MKMIKKLLDEYSKPIDKNMKVASSPLPILKSKISELFGFMKDTLPGKKREYLQNSSVIAETLTSIAGKNSKY